jgi:Uncharacterized conserved protein (DUF2075)
VTRAYYSASAERIAADSPGAILGALVARSLFDVNTAQRDGWVSEITQLRELTPQTPGAHFFLEFSIPRIGRRADVVILWKGVVFVVEYKVGSQEYAKGAIDQALGYALDLKNFHETSHDRRIVPVLVATGAPAVPVSATYYEDQVAVPARANAVTLFTVLKAFTQGRESAIDPISWEAGRYRPTPTIIEAAQALYRKHSVEEISRNEAGAENLSTTAAYIGGVIERAKANRRKAICLVTGVPGSGKTLAGLNIANQRMQGHEDEHAVFLSGNGPLVHVLREALARDALDRARESGVRSTHTTELGRASAFIQNIHHFRDEALQSADPMVGKVVVFDEAQRAWNVDQTSKFMREKRGQSGFRQSEPEFLLGVMDRHRDWCVVIGLVGGGQEINTGEAGLGEWLQALSIAYPAWEVHMPSQLLGSDYLSTGATERFEACRRAILAPALHLSVSIRSFRAEKLSEFVSALLSNQSDEAKRLFADLEHYPFVITRDLATARAWLRRHRRGNERAGLLASSNALRLKPEGVFVRAKIEPADWFLAPHEDVRSSDSLEDSASEFEVQGLELDWAGVCWDANLRRSQSNWETFRFSGTQWQKVRDADRQSFLLNSYRVLLTRARQGMVIFVPRGDPNDRTRDPTIYDGIEAFLRECGIPLL